MLDETDTLSILPHTFPPEADNYKELCMAYRQDLAEAREEIKKLREAYFKLMESNNKLMAEITAIEVASVKGVSPLPTMKQKKA